MKLLKPLLWIIGLGAVCLIGSLDFNGLGNWLNNEVTLEMSTQVKRIDVGKPWHIEIRTTRRNPFGEFEEVSIPADQYQLSMKPLDDQSERLASLENGTMTVTEPGILHLKFRIDLLPKSPFRFMGSEPMTNTWRQIVGAGVDPNGEWRTIDVEKEPAHIQRHLSVLSRFEYDGSGGTYLPWSPEEVLSTEEITLMCGSVVSTLRGNSSLHHSYFSYDGTTDQEIPTPPLVRGSPQTCLFNNQWILAGGELPDVGYSIDQIVLAWDLKTRAWSQLPTLPEETSHVVAVFDRQGELAVYSPPHDDQTDEWSPLTLYVLREGKWNKEDRLNYDFPVGDTFPFKEGLLCIATQDLNNPVKYLHDGKLRTIGIAKGYSANSPVAVIDNRIIQWTANGVYELIDDP